MADPLTRLSIIVPAFNEADSILDVLEAIAGQRRNDIDFEVIVADDGSTDGTAQKVEARPDLYTHLVRLAVNGGKGAAVKAGLTRATGDYVLIQDADREYDPSDYPALLQPVFRRNADIVMGSRMIAPAMTRVHYYWHRTGNRLITFLFNVTFNTTFTDIYSGYLLYRRALLDPAELKTTGWEQHAEMLGRLVPRAERIYEVPISYFGRTYAEGKKIRARHVITVVLEIVRRRFVT